MKWNARRRKGTQGRGQKESEGRMGRTQMYRKNKTKQGGKKKIRGEKKDTLSIVCLRKK